MDLLRRRFLALADSSRLLALLLLEAEGELCLCQLQEVLELAPSTVSRHMQPQGRSLGPFSPGKRSGLTLARAGTHEQDGKKTAQGKTTRP
jgi:DNA-binding transcriptional ArsR family regulator